MKKWITERFKYGDQQVIYVDDINKYEYCVCPFSPLPDPDFPKKGQESEEKEDDHEDADARHPRFSDSNDRIASFTSWPHQNPSPQTLAEAGFFYVKGTTDDVSCFSCGFGFNDFHPSDDPLQLHSRHRPNCQYIRRILGPNIGERLVSSSFYYVYQLQKKKVKQNPRYPQFATVQARLESYRDWPSNVTQSHQSLAEAGLYYTGVGDLVKCFSCGGGLRSWSPDDDPWIEHCRWFRNCPYAIAERGENYVAMVHAATSIMEVQDMNEDSDDEITDQVENAIYTRPLMIQSNDQPTEQSNEEQGNDTLHPENQLYCTMCQENSRNALFLPCAHLVLCISCAEGFNHCPVCNKEIGDKIKIYR